MNVKHLINYSHEFIRSFVINLVSYSSTCLTHRSDEALEFPKLLEKLMRKSLGKKIYKLLISMDVVNINLFPVVLLSNQIVFNLDVLGLLVILEVFLLIG